MDRDPLYAPARDPAVDDCCFYHVMDLPGHGTVGGHWDLRGKVDEYLGQVGLAGKRVLEIGPASGFVTFEMERRGADVVAIDLPVERAWDFVPLAHLDMAAIEHERLRVMEQVRNAFWFAHGLFESRAKVCYRDTGSLPDELGRFDVAVMACVLLHARDPLQIINSCARLADERLVIAELFFPELEGCGPVCRVDPSKDSDVWDTWWSFTPELFVQYLEAIGFSDVEVTYHEQLHTSAGPRKLFTVVATR